jgi:hypothetical protein
MAHLTVDLNDAELLARMKNFEDHLVERKTIGDQKDWRKTVVAFANSAPVGLPAVLYIGVRDNGEIETPQQNLDSTQRTFNRLMQDVYPRVSYVPKIVTENGLQALAVIIPGSELRPHFAGLSYVRRGSETFEASEEQFAELVAQRLSKTRILSQWLGKDITVAWKPLRNEARNNTIYRLTTVRTTVSLVTAHWVTFQVHSDPPGRGDRVEVSEPMEKLLLSWDDFSGHLKVEVIG